MRKSGVKCRVPGVECRVSGVWYQVSGVGIGTALLKRLIKKYSNLFRTMIFRTMKSIL